MHKKVRGELHEAAGRFPAGTPYAADDPELLLWILATLVDSGIDRLPALRAPADAAASASRCGRTTASSARLFGLPDETMPRDATADFRRYMRAHARRRGPERHRRGARHRREIVMRPPVPLAALPLVELANFVTVGLLPLRIRREYGFSWDPARGLVFCCGHTEYARRVLVPCCPGAALQRAPPAMSRGCRPRVAPSSRPRALRIPLEPLGHRRLRARPARRSAAAERRAA